MKEIAAIVDADPNVVVDMDADVVAVVLLDALSCSWTSLRSNETGQHGDDALKELTCLAEVGFTEHSQRLQSVEHGCALQRGAPGNRVEPHGVSAEFPASLREVEGHGQGGAPQLIDEVAVAPRNPGDELRHQPQELDRRSIDV